jgi:hypothetical protein
MRDRCIYNYRRYIGIFFNLEIPIGSLYLQAGSE